MLNDFAQPETTILDYFTFGEHLENIVSYGKCKTMQCCEVGKFFLRYFRIIIFDLYNDRYSVI